MERMGQRALGARRGTGGASPSSRALPHRHRHRVAPVLALAVAAACAASRRYRDETRTVVETDLVFNAVSEDQAGVSGGGATTGRLPSARENAEWDEPPSDTKDDYSYDGYDGYDYDGYDYDGYEQGHGTPETALERTSYPKMNRTSYSEMNKVCRTIPKEGRPLYTQEEWQRFRRIYRDTGGITIDVDAPVPDHFKPPLISGHTNDGKGRGIFAARDIQRGERIAGGKDNYAFFRDGPSYLRFLNALSEIEACDVTMWAWTQISSGGAVDEPLILLPLDENSFENSGGGRSNTGCPPEIECGMFDEFALRDIAEGEELLCQYGEFADTSLWHKFDLK